MRPIAGAVRTELLRWVHDSERLATTATEGHANRGGTTIRDPTRQASASGLGHLGTLERQDQERKLWAFPFTLGSINAFSFLARGTSRGHLRQLPRRPPPVRGKLGLS